MIKGLSVEKFRNGAVIKLTFQLHYGGKYISDALVINEVFTYETSTGRQTLYLPDKIFGSCNVARHVTYHHKSEEQLEVILVNFNLLKNNESPQLIDRKEYLVNDLGDVEMCMELKNKQ